MAVARSPEPVTTRPPRLTSPGSRMLALAGLALAAVACLVLIALTVPRLSAADDREQRRTEVLQAARQQAVNFTTLVASYPVRSIDETAVSLSSPFVPPPGTRALERSLGAGAFCAPRTLVFEPRGSAQRASVLAGTSDVAAGVRWSVPS